MIDRNRVGVLLVGLAVATLVALPQARAQFKDETTVVVVEVPVNVIRDGAPVRDLTVDDFEIFDGRKKQDIIGFEIVDLSQVGEAAESTRVTEVPSAGRRHFLLIFDLSLSDPASVERARTAARQLMHEGLHPADLVGVATYSQAKGARMVLNFSPNRDQAEVAIATLGLSEPAHRIEDPLSMMIGDDMGQEGATSGDGAGRAEAMIEEMSRDFRTLSNRVERDQQKNRVIAMTDSLTVLADMMQSVDGRKHVVFLSEGFPTEIFTGVENIERQLEMAREAEFGEYQRIDSSERFGDTQASGALQSMVDAFLRADCAVQTVDIGGLDAGPDADNKAVRNEGLFRMARETGGEFYQNFNNLDDAMSEVLERTSVTYILAFQPKNLKLDGKFHKLKVELKNDIKGARLVHRPGYYPPKPFEQQSVMERKLATAATLVGGEQGGSFLTSALAAPFPSPLAQSYVPVLVEVDGASLLSGHKGDVLLTEIYAYAFDEQGAVKDFFVRRLGLDTKAAARQLEQSGFKYYGHLELDPGSYALRVLVRNGTTGDSSLSVVNLTVPDQATGEPALVAPLFPEAPNKWIFGRESEEEQLAGAPYPFMLGEQPFVPAARPVMTRGANVICLPGYSLGDGTLSISGQLFTPDGAPAGDVEMKIVDRPRTGIPRFDRLVAEVSPGGVPNGDYLLVVTVTDLASGASSSASADVTVGG